MHSPPVTPWYKQFWPWFLIGLLMLSISVSSTFAFLAIRSADGMVQEDYYEYGRAINMVLAKQERAAELGIEASLRIDPLTSDVVVDLEGSERYPDQLDFELIFPTRDNRDIELTLEHVRDGRYLGQAPDNLRYRWYLQLQPSEEPEWRLVGEGQFPNETAVRLTPGRAAPANDS